MPANSDDFEGYWTKSPLTSMRPQSRLWRSAYGDTLALLSWSRMIGQSSCAIYDVMPELTIMRIILRWFNRVVVEGIPPRQAFDHEVFDDSATDSNSEDDDDVRKGATYRVGNGKIRLTPGGMSQYVGIVERRMAKRDAAQGKA